MATTRGFVERIEVGRGGLVRVTLVDQDGRRTFRVSDIDGDPERFNERLSKIAILRDAMGRAEPVEVEHDGGDGEPEIQRAARVSRDQLTDAGALTRIAGVVIGMSVESRNAVAASELHDTARVTLIGLDATPHEVILDLQAPERLVAVEQLQMLRDAHASGSPVALLVAADEEGPSPPEVISVWVGAGLDGRTKERGPGIAGFVEALGTLLPDQLQGLAGSLALTRITTGPRLDGLGGHVDPAAFTPETVGLLVARGSAGYALLHSATTENVRVRVGYIPLDRGGPDRGGSDDEPERVVVAAHLAHAGTAYPGYAEEQPVAAEVEHEGGGDVVAGLVLSVELQAPLASASRPVWVHVDREMLDRGPEAGCVPGLPSTSLQPRSLRDLRIPYPAEWVGHGCFNRGVYRFQLHAPEGTTLTVDGTELCLFAAEEPDVSVGYACMDGDHVVSVRIAEYVCDTVFDMDVYRVR